MENINPHIRNFILQTADNSLILGHRLSEWCGHGPALEQDIALTNLALDLIGQTRLYYQHLAELEGKSEDDYAYLRDIRSYKNLLLCEQENKDFAYTVVRSFLFDQFHFLLLKQLTNISYTPLKHIAAQALKEVSYHKKYSAEWMIRLGDGTEESHSRIQQALDDLWTYSGEMFEKTEADDYMENVFELDFQNIQLDWKTAVEDILHEATLEIPESGWMQSGGKKGIHTEHMGFLLAELQYMQRTYPNATW